MKRIETSAGGRSWRWPLLSLAAGLLAWLATRLLSRDPALAEALYGPVSPLIARPLSQVTGALPIAVAEFVVGGYAAWLLALGGIAIAAVIRRRRSWTHVLGGGARRLLRDGGLVLVLFYVLWGANYARPAFADRAGWPAWSGAEVPELIALAEAATAEVNRSYIALHGSEDAGVPTALPADVRTLNAAIDEGWRRAAAILPLPPVAAATHGPVKWPRAGGLLARLGISGIYVPFTAEANVVRGQPAIRVPVSMAHEKAHQRGFTWEADANFLGFMAAALAPDPLARYAAASFAQTQLLGALGGRAPEQAERIAGQRLPGVARDVEDLWAYYLRMLGLAADFGSALNHRFLMANGVDDGVGDYRRSTWLLVMQARQNGGELFPLRGE